MAFQLFTICMFALLSVDVLRAQDRLWIRTVDEQRVKAALESFDLELGATLTLEDGQPMKVAAADLIWFWFQSRPSAVTDESAIITLVNGDILPGSVVGGDHSEIILGHAVLGPVHLPLDQVATYRKAGQPEPRVEPLPIDRVTLGNGDALAGTVVAVGRGRVTIDTEIGSVDVPTDHILTMTLANSAQQTPSEPHARVYLRDGTAVMLSTCRWRADDAQITGNVAMSPDKERKIDADQIVRLSIMYGRAQPLSLLKAETVLTRGHFDSELWAEWFSPMVSNVQDKRWAPFFSVISLHSHTLLRVQLPEGWAGGRLEFFARGDPHAPEWAQTNLVISIEGESLFSQTFAGREGNTSGQEPLQLFKVDVPEVGSLDVSAEFGPFGEPHGRLDIIEPVLINRR